MASAPSLPAQSILELPPWALSIPQCWVLGFLILFTKHGLLRKIPTVMLIFFFNPCPQGGWELLLDPLELGCFFLIPSTPYRSCLHPVPPKALEVGDLDSSASSATDPTALAHPCPLSQCLHTYITWGGDQTPPAFPMAYSFYSALRLPSILSSRPMAGPQGRTGEWEEDNGYSLFCFLKKYSLFRAYGNFQSAAVLHLSNYLFVQSNRLLGWAQKLLPC